MGLDPRKEMEGPPPPPPPSERTHSSTFRIVDEVRSIRFNQEQEEELMQRYLSWNMSLESRSSVDIREMTREQDLITALVNRKKVQLLSFPLAGAWITALPVSQAGRRAAAALTNFPSLAKPSLLLRSPPGPSSHALSPAKCR